MTKIITLTLFAMLSASFAQTEGKKTSDLSARPLQAGDKVIVATALGANAAGNVGDDVVALQAEDARTDNPHAVTKAQLGLSNADNTSDADKPVSDAAQAALDLLAPIASPTFTGTVSGVTKAMVGLSNVDNTSDADKPISDAAQLALDPLNVANVSALASLAPADGATAIAQGYYAAGDGGGNVYSYSIASTATIDGGFVINGPGSVGRFLAVDQKAANVKQFGATGDGVTDDTAAIQAALDSGAASIGVPAGTYACGDLTASGPSSVILGRGTLLATTTDGEMLTLGASGIRLEGLTLDGNSTASQGIVIGAGLQRVTVVGCEVRNLAQTAGSLIVAGVNVHGDGYAHSIINCYLHDLDATVGGVSRGVFVSTNGGASQVSKHVTVDGGVIADISPSADGDGVHVQDPEVASHFSVKNVSFENCAKRAIKIQADYVSVEGVKIVNDVVEAAAPLIDVYGSYADVSGFQISGKRAGSGIAAGTSLYDVTNVTFRGGSISLDPAEVATGKFGIEFTGVVRRSTFSDLDIVGGQGGVRARLYASEAVTFDSLRIGATAASSVGMDFSLLDHSFLKVRGCHITGVTYGIHLNLGASMQVIGVTGSSTSWFIRQDAVRSDLVIIRPRMYGELLGYDPGPILDGGAEEVDITVPGAAFGDFCKVALQRSWEGMIVSGHVSAADTVTVRLQNDSGSTVDLVAGGVFVEVESIDDRRF